jgi:RNA recognition motif-containing protein
MFLKYFAKNNFVYFRRGFFSYLKEPEEYRTVYIENLPHDWKEDEIKVRLEQIGTIERLHIVKNSLGESTGKGKILFY